MSDEPTLIERLRALARAEHDDLSVADEAADELESYDKLFDLMWKATHRATELYNAAHPGMEGTLPDHGKMIGWLCDELERKR